MALTATTGTISGRPPTWVRVVCVGSRVWITDMSALVPPMSNVIRFSNGVCPAATDAATTPDAGPDRIVSIGRCRAVSMLSVPPLLLVM